MGSDKDDLDARYLEYRERTAKIAAEIGSPIFYSEERAAVERSGRLFASHPTLKSLLFSLGNNEDYPGHGLSHVKKVALDAGALILIDGTCIAPSGQINRLVFLSHLSGLLHDIRRSEPDHARRGAEEADRILKTLDVGEDEAAFIVQAIANHEAFQPAQSLEDPAAQLLSDALYDADKFRWGPDNFTETLWSIAMTRRINLDVLTKYFPRGIEATERIRSTFRTETGRKYGPDFIDRALEIGKRLYSCLLSSA